MKNHPPAKNQMWDSLLSPELIKQFSEESIGLLESAENDLLLLENNPTSKELVDSSFRSLHSLKGNAGYLEFTDIIEVCHNAETFLDSVRNDENEITSQKVTVLLQAIDSLRKAIDNLSIDKPPMIAAKVSLLNLMDVTFNDAVVENAQQKISAAQQSEKDKKVSGKSTSDEGFIRVDVEKLNRLMDLVGEIVISESMVSQHPELQDIENPDFEKSIRNHQKNIRELQEIATSIRMIPLNWVFNKLNRVVRDISDKEHKKVDLVIKGGETEMDRTVIESISDPLVHILRNAIDHGIEEPALRRKNGKPEKGKIELTARRVSGEIWIEVEDDGIGLDTKAILERASQQGVVKDHIEDITSEKIYNLIFTSGLSTAKEVTDISGRGVGMDVVARNIEKIRGRVDVQSNPGQGTKITLKIPLTTAIIDGMLMRVHNSIYAIPTQDIKESIHINGSKMIRLSRGREVLSVRDKVIPILRLDEIHKIKDADTSKEEGIVVIAENGTNEVGFFVDEIIGQRQMVLKTLTRYADNILGVSGCAVLGNGDISLILDLLSLIKISEIKQL